jgi:streptogramin lyase
MEKSKLESVLVILKHMWKGDIAIHWCRSIITALVIGCMFAAPSLASPDDKVQGRNGNEYAFVVGSLKSGSRSIARAKVILYRAGEEMGGTATRLGKGVTDVAGNFSIAYRQPLSNAVLYLVARGPEGSRNLGTGVKLAAILGPSLPRVKSVMINERTTVAAAWSMAQFLEGENLAGKSPGLQNAAGMNANLVDVRTGRIARVLGTSPNGSETTTLAAFNSLANIIAACVDLKRPDSCEALFTLATPLGGVSPRNTLDAALNIAHFPANNASELFTFSQLDGKYTPALDQSPDAWTLCLKFTGLSFDGPANMVFDPDGNVWSTNNYEFGTTTGAPGKTIIKLSPTGLPAPGTPFSGGGVLGSAFGIAMDQEGFVWVGNFAKSEDPPTEGSLSKFSPDGIPLSPDSGYTEGGANQVQGLAVDQEGNVWFANFGNNSLGMYPGGNPKLAKNITSGGLSRPFGVAVDGKGHVWVTNGAFRNSTDSVSKFSRNGTALSPESGFTGGGLNSPKGIAIDSQGNAWVANLGQFPTQPSDGITMLHPNGKPAAGTPFKGGGILGGWGIAVDGKDNIWVANFSGQSISHLCGANPVNCPPFHRTGDPISPPTGYTSNALQRLTSVVIDSSGNVWVPNNWKHIPIRANPGGDGLVVFLGLAAPVKTPLIGPPQEP